MKFDRLTYSSSGNEILSALSFVEFIGLSQYFKMEYHNEECISKIFNQSCTCRKIFTAKNLHNIGSRHLFDIGPVFIISLIS